MSDDSLVSGRMLAEDSDLSNLTLEPATGHSAVDECQKPFLWPQVFEVRREIRKSRNHLLG